MFEYKVELMSKNTTKERILWLLNELGGCRWNLVSSIGGDSLMQNEFKGNIVLCFKRLLQ